MDSARGSQGKASDAAQGIPIQKGRRCSSRGPCCRAGAHRNRRRPRRIASARRAVNFRQRPRRCPANALPLYCGARCSRLPRTAAATKGTRPCGGRTAKLHRSEDLHDRRQVAAACWGAIAFEVLLQSGPTLRRNLDRYHRRPQPAPCVLGGRRQR